MLRRQGTKPREATESGGRCRDRTPFATLLAGGLFVDLFFSRFPDELFPGTETARPSGPARIKGFACFES